MDYSGWKKANMKSLLEDFEDSGEQDFEKFSYEMYWYITTGQSYENIWTQS